MSQPSPIGLVLTGGGARGAYQSGALTAISQIAESMGIRQPFPIITGTSAGAINAAFLAAQAKNIRVGCNRLQKIWTVIRTEMVYRTDLVSLAKISLSWMTQLSLGGAWRAKQAQALLDTSPLWDKIVSRIQYKKIQENIESGALHSLAINLINYTDGHSNSFFQGGPDIQPWERAGRRGIRGQITAEHIMASSAIPILFPAVMIDGSAYGDGSLRNYTPLSPAIKLGATKLLVIGVRKDADVWLTPDVSKPSVARIVSVVLNTVLLDAIDHDYERLSRINSTLSKLPTDSPSGLKPVEVFMLRPSKDLGEMALEESANMPKTIRYLLKGLGNGADAADLMSYILFEPPFTTRLTKLGYDDTMAREAEIRNFYSNGE